MEKEFADVTIETLNLNLLDIRNSNVKKLMAGLTIYPDAKKELEFCGRQITLAVIGESHFLLVAGMFMELLVCKILAEELFAGILRLDKISGEALNNKFCTYRVNGLNYYFKAEFIAYWQAKSVESTGPVLFSCEEEFPFIFHGEEIPCKTRLHLSQPNARTLCLQTRHDYPHPDGVSVLTKSLFNFPTRSRGI